MNCASALSPYDGGYDAEVVRADSIVGRFLNELKKRGLYRSALIILLSDHGEGSATTEKTSTASFCIASRSGSAHCEATGK